MSINVFADAFLQTLEDEVPALFHKCPYQGLIGVWGINIDRLMSSVLPQIVPAGLYKVLIRFHTSKNSSIANVEVIAQVDAADIMKRINMGK